MRPIRIATFCAAALALAIAGQAQAENVPPGLSGAEQYVETTPTVTGGNPTGNSGSGGAGSSGKVIGQANADRLAALGVDGTAAARLAAEGAPDHPPATGEGGGASADPQGSSGVGQVVGQLTGAKSSGGMGVLLPLLIATGAVLAAVYGIGRRRGGRTSQLGG
jgi:hypothetical protein